MLGLTEQISSHDRRIGGVVGNDHHLGGPGQQINPYRSKKLPLGFGKVHIPGTDHHVDWLRILYPERHAGQSLNTTDTENLIRTGRRHCR